MSLHKKKGEDIKIYNLINDEFDETKPFTKFINIVGDNITYYTPETIIYFHHERDSRIKGQSTEGKIFYYEALKEGQEFISYVTGEKEYLDKFKACFSSTLQARIGRSRNTQYGLIDVSLDEINAFNKRIYRPCFVGIFNIYVFCLKFGRCRR